MTEDELKAIERNYGCLTPWGAAQPAAAKMVAGLIAEVRRLQGAGRCATCDSALFCYACEE